MCKDHVLRTSKLPRMSVLFEGKITLVLAFRGAGGRALRQIRWGTKSRRAPRAWRAVFCCLRLWDGELSASCCVRCEQPVVWRMSFRCILFLVFKNNFGDKGWWILAPPPPLNFEVWFWNGCHMLWYPCEAVLIIYLKIYPGFLRTEGCHELYCFQVACLKAINNTYRSYA